MTVFGRIPIEKRLLDGLSILHSLAEIFDFAAPRTFPKKTSIAKSDLLNSTAAQGDCSWEILLPQRHNLQNSTARLWNLDFRYGDELELMLSYGFA